MDTRTEGAWIIHHKNKLDTISGAQSDFEEISLAGKCSTLLSAISSTDEIEIDNARLNALAIANGISRRMELPQLLEELQRQRLINRNENGIEIIGLTSLSILEHTTKIFNDSNPNAYEKAVIDLSEKASVAPVLYDGAKEYISDTYKIDNATSDDVLDRGKRIGFFDYEKTKNGDELLFNGNLFRSSEISKISKVMSALSEGEIRQTKEINELLDIKGCVPLEDVVSISGTQLFDKLQGIGLFDVNSIFNEDGHFLFVTKPASFCKFSSSIIDDAFDLAKAFVTSLTYGILMSPNGRGRIKIIEALMNKLIAGHWVGPATAIGHDYKMLELKGVVKVSSAGNGLYSMKLLKKDVGILALAVIQEGSAASIMLTSIPGASIASYSSPEQNRTIVRKKMAAPIKKGVSDLLYSIRTGEI